ncbi:MAG: hypothetical protein Q7R40_20175 [Phaeospirillum sp.]|nr:hypothetical protein [Phaeospirillum sp.]
MRSLTFGWFEFAPRNQTGGYGLVRHCGLTSDQQALVIQNSDLSLRYRKEESPDDIWAFYPLGAGKLAFSRYTKLGDGTRGTVFRVVGIVGDEASFQELRWDRESLIELVRTASNLTRESRSPIAIEPLPISPTSTNLHPPPIPNLLPAVLDILRRGRDLTLETSWPAELRLALCWALLRSMPLQDRGQFSFITRLTTTRPVKFRFGLHDRVDRDVATSTNPSAIRLIAKEESVFASVSDKMEDVRRMSVGTSVTEWFALAQRDEVDIWGFSLADGKAEASVAVAGLLFSNDLTFERLQLAVDVLRRFPEANGLLLRVVNDPRNQSSPHVAAFRFIAAAAPLVDCVVKFLNDTGRSASEIGKAFDQTRNLIPATPDLLLEAMSRNGMHSRRFSGDTRIALQTAQMLMIIESHPGAGEAILPLSAETRARVFNSPEEATSWLERLCDRDTDLAHALLTKWLATLPGSQAHSVARKLAEQVLANGRSKPALCFLIMRAMDSAAPNVVSSAERSEWQLRTVKDLWPVIADYIDPRFPAKLISKEGLIRDIPVEGILDPRLLQSLIEAIFSYFVGELETTVATGKLPAAFWDHYPDWREKQQPEDRHRIAAALVGLLVHSTEAQPSRSGFFADLRFRYLLDDAIGWSSVPELIAAIMRMEWTPRDVMRLASEISAHNRPLLQDHMPSIRQLIGFLRPSGNAIDEDLVNAFRFARVAEWGQRGGRS